MLVAILKDKINNIDSYLYLKKRNNKYIYYGYNIDNDGVSNIDKNIVTRFYDLFKINNNCVYIEDYNNYQVYYDQKNKFKHYIKDGKEDFLMFFLFNGIDATSYASKKHSKSTVKRFSFADKCLSVLASLAIFVTIGVSIEGAQYISYQVNESAYEVSENLEFEIAQADVDKALNLINDSNNIDTDTKKFLCNEEFINDVFSHYDSKMKYTINSKLENITIKDFEQKEKPEASGFYVPVEMNNMYILDSIEDKSNDWYKVLSHEYVHLFQSNDIEFIYIKESSAELISSEYFNNNIDAYHDAVFNLKLLVEVVGPEVIWDLNFTGDETKLNDILKNNLTSDEYEKLYNYLIKSPNYDAEELDHQDIKSLIYRLYKNMYGIEMKDNYMIYNSEGNYINKKAYFNQSKMEEICCSYSIKEAEELGFIKSSTFYRYEKEISESEFEYFLNKLVNNNDSSLENVYINFEIISKEYILNGKRQFINKMTKNRNEIVFYFSEGGTLSLDVKEAVELEYIKNVKYYYTYDTNDFNNETIKDMKKTDYCYKKYYSAFTSNELLNNKYILHIPTIQDRFPNQSIRKNNVDNVEKTSKL